MEGELCTLRTVSDLEFLLLSGRLPPVLTVPVNPAPRGHVLTRADTKSPVALGRGCTECNLTFTRSNLE